MASPLGMAPARSPGRPACGSVVYLHGVGRLRPDWAAPIHRALGGLTIDVSAPSYDDLLATRGRIYARDGAREAKAASEAERHDYVDRQRRLTALIDSVGESTRLAWPAGVPHPADVAARLPWRHVLRTSLFGLDQMGRYLEDGDRRAAVLHRVRGAMLAAPRPRVLIAHSLGSLVAMDLLEDPRIEVDLLITLGSPLGFAFEGRADGSRRLTDFPYGRVGGWLNLVHVLDPVTAGRGLQHVFPESCDAYLSPTAGLAASSGALARAVAAASRAATSHLESSYLESRTVAVALREAMVAAAVRGPRAAAS